jgi:hypothetical protein
MLEQYLNKIFIFHTEAGCIPAGSVCYCFAIDWPFFHVHFEREILGGNSLKIHFNVIKENATLKR